MVKQYIKYLLAVLVTVILIPSCIQETYPDGGTIVEEPTIEELLNGLPSDLSAAGVSGLYANTGYHIDFGIPSIHIMTECMLEDLVICGASRYFQYNDYAMNLNQGPTSSYSSYFWLVYYQAIRSANEIIARIDKKTEEKDEQYWLAQALTYRAMCYLDLARLYEPKQNSYVPVDGNLLGLTVPKVVETTTVEDATNNPRVGREDMYTFILDDLNVAEVLMNASGQSSSILRPNISAIYGLKARAYIEMGTWDINAPADAFKKVIENADKVIAAHTPLTAGQWHDPSAGFNRSASASAWVWGLSLDSSMTNNLFNFTAMMSVEAQFSYAQFTYPGISSYLYSKISDSDFRKTTWFVRGSGLDYKFSGTLEDAMQTEKYGVNYMSLKFRPAQGNCTDYSVGAAAEHPLMRVEEMYFLKMEALAHTDLTQAISTLESFMNTYRYTDGSYSCTATTLDEFIQEMMIQKRVEFWGEGILIYDYKRLGLGITRDYKGSVLTNYQKDYLLNTTGCSPQWNICIPLSEMQTNSAISSDLNNPDPTGFTGDPQKVL